MASAMTTPQRRSSLDYDRQVPTSTSPKGDETLGYAYKSFQLEQVHNQPQRCGTQQPNAHASHHAEQNVKTQDNEESRYGQRVGDVNAIDGKADISSAIAGVRTGQSDEDFLAARYQNRTKRKRQAVFSEDDECIESEQSARKIKASRQAKRQHSVRQAPEIGQAEVPNDKENLLPSHTSVALLNRRATQEPPPNDPIWDEGLGGDRSKWPDDVIFRPRERDEAGWGVDWRSGCYHDPKNDGMADQESKWPSRTPVYRTLIKHETRVTMDRSCATLGWVEEHKLFVPRVEVKGSAAGVAPIKWVRFRQEKKDFEMDWNSSHHIELLNRWREQNAERFGFAKKRVCKMVEYTQEQKLWMFDKALSDVNEGLMQSTASPASNYKARFGEDVPHNGISIRGLYDRSRRLIKREGASGRAQLDISRPKKTTKRTLEVLAAEAERKKREDDENQAAEAERKKQEAEKERAEMYEAAMTLIALSRSTR